MSTSPEPVDPVPDLRLARTYITSVSDVRRKHRPWIDVTCRGGDLVDFPSLGADEFVHVLAPPAGSSRLTIDRSFTWGTYEHLPDAQRPVGAYYSVRRWRAPEAALELSIVAHGAGGEGCRWAERVRAGDPVALWGPRRIFDPPTGTDWYPLVGDETGVPAIGAILDALPADARTEVIVELDDPRDELPLAVGPNGSISRVHRHGRPPGSTSLLTDAVRALRWAARCRVRMGWRRAPCDA